MKMVTYTISYFPKKRARKNLFDSFFWCCLFFLPFSQLALAEKTGIFIIDEYAASFDMMPVAIPDNYSTSINTAISRTAADADDLLDNDSVVPDVFSFGGGSLGGTMNDHPAGTTAVVGGHSVTVNSDGSFTYIPASGFTGNFTFYYYSQSNGPASALVTIEVQNVCPPANIIYVNDNAGGNNDGSSWTDAFTDLQNALNSTCPGITQIWVAAGTYVPGTLRTDAFVMKNNLAIYGGFAGGENMLTQRNWTANVTTLSGEIGAAGNGDNSFHVIFNDNNGLNSSALLDGFTITKGNADDSTTPYGQSGGGMQNVSSAPAISNCTFTDNTGDVAGGGIANESASPTITNCTFDGNFTASFGGGGGGIYNDNSSPIIKNCSFTNNNSGFSQGGGIHNRNSSSPQITNCLFLTNSGLIYGGGIFNDGSSPTITNCSFSGNNGNNNGNALADYQNSFSTVNNCIFWGNNGSEISNINGSASTINNSIVQGGCPASSNCTNVINEDPLFVSATGLRLTECSPALDAGDDNDNNEPLDLDGNPRKFEAFAGGSEIDLGAYEHQAVVDICTACLTSGNIVYVKESAAGNNNGKSWTDAFNDLQDALAVANTCTNVTEIWVAAGTYVPGTLRTDAFVMKNNLAIYGGFAGGETMLLQRDWAANVTTLSGEIGAGGNGDNSLNIIRNENNGLNNTAVLDGFTISGGNANFLGINDDGGGMYNSTSSPKIANCIFSGNSAFDLGGGIINFSASPLIINCSFNDNSALSGGGMFNFGTTNGPTDATVINCTFSGNTVTDVGGGICNNFANPVVTNCIIWGNSSGIANFSSNPTVTYSIVQGGHTHCTNCPNTDGNIDPLFVSGTDLHLQACSPAIDAGDDTANNEPTDLDGNARKFEAIAGGSLIDLGAYEYQSVVNPVTYYTDADGDSFGTGPGQDFCTNPGAGWALVDGDCDDGDMDINPNATEVCDGVDNNCVNGIDEGNVCCPAGNIFYVNDDAAGANDGSSWADAFNDLQDALTSACPGITEIWVAEGTYKPTSGTDRNISFQMKNNLAILGGFPDTGDPNLNDRDWKVHETILSGDIGVPGVVTDNSHSVVVSNTGVDASGVIDGFTVTGADGGEYSGGLLASNSSPTILNCLFKNNSSGYIGGGLMCFVASPTIANCIFLENHSVLFGGGIANAFVGSPNINKCVFTGNTAGNFGGGIYSQDNTNPISISNCAFSENSCNNSGGGIGIQSGNDINISNCIFDGNTAGNGIGGGVFSQILNNSLTLFNCTFLNNSSEAIRSLSAATISNIIVWGNGAGISNASQPIQNCIIEGGYSPCVNCPNGDGDVDPLFVGGNDYHLTECSPAIDAGTNIGAPTDDLDGNARPFNATGVNNVDIGAYEFQGTFDVCTACLTSGNVIYVNDDAAGNNNGKSWADAFNDLQDALAVANTCPNVTEIWVAAGTYTPGTNRTDAFVMKNNLAIYGGFPNTGNPGFGDRNPDPATNGTILSGEIGMAGISDNSQTVVIGSNTDNTAVLDGFTITAGNADQDFGFPSPGARGGGMHNNAGLPTVANCLFIENYGAFGGGMYNLNSSPTITQCSFISNSGTFGGGIYSEGTANATITNCSFTNNEVVNSGGGVFQNSSVNLNYLNCSFNSNSAAYGGAICTGGFAPAAAMSTMTNCSFVNNTTTGGGGAVNNGFLNSSANVSMSFEKCYFKDNICHNGTTIGTGGAYQSQSPTFDADFVNCVMDGNKALGSADDGGGALMIYAGNVTMTNTTIANSESATRGGAVSVYGNGASFTVKNSILWNNNATSSNSIYNGIGGTANAEFSLLQEPSCPPNVTCGAGMIFNQDPLFTNGLQLSECSPAIDRGTATGAPFDDFDGAGRPVNAVPNIAGDFDMGAYEFQGTTPAPIPSCTANLSVPLNGNSAVVLAEEVGNSSAGCGDLTLLINDQTSLTFDCDDVGTQTVTLKVTNFFLNTATTTCSFTITDNEIPVAICPATIADIELDANGNGTLPANIGDGSSTDNCAATETSPATNFTCGNIGVQMVTLTASDGTNSSTANCSFNVKDILPPVATCKDVTIELDNGGVWSIGWGDINDNSFDPCGIATYLINGEDFIEYTCAEMGANTAVLTVVDPSGNPATCNATVTVEDNIPPIATCKDVTIELDNGGVWSIGWGDINDNSFDPCGIATYLINGEDFIEYTCTEVGVNTAVLTVIDPSGNPATCNATVTVEDNNGPTAVCTTTTINATLNANGDYAVDPNEINDGSSDACGGVTLAVSPALLTCQHEGMNTVMLTVTDANGNTNTCTATVEVAPFITLSNMVSTAESCAGAGDGSITITATAGGGQLGYSIDGGLSYQYTGTFNNVTPGVYNLRLKVFGIPNICEKTATVTVEAGGATATWYQDIDNDGYSDGNTQPSCTQPNGYKLQADLTGPEIDCNDNDPSQFPGQVWYKDSDNDGYSDGATQTSCTRPTGYKSASELVLTSGDCNDTNANIHPNATETCNGIDDDCDGDVDEGLSGETYVGNVMFTTQAQLDAWPSCYSTIQGYVTIQGAGINNLGPLSNITTITGNLMILMNSSLTSLNGLENLTTVGGAFYMYYNFILSNCCAIDNLLTNGGIAGTILIFYNKTGSHCNSAAAIMAACPIASLVGNPNDATISGGAVTLQEGKRMGIYPNPASNEVNLLFDRTAPTATLRVMDMLGRVVYEMELEEWTDRVTIGLSGSRFENGLYLVSLYEDGEMTTKQLVIQQ